MVDGSCSTREDGTEHGHGHGQDARAMRCFKYHLDFMCCIFSLVMRDGYLSLLLFCTTLRIINVLILQSVLGIYTYKIVFQPTHHLLPFLFQPISLNPIPIPHLVSIKSTPSPPHPSPSTLHASPLLVYSPNNRLTRLSTLSFSGSYGWSLLGISSTAGNASVKASTLFRILSAIFDHR